jgi:hypothetical protein
MQLKYMFFVLLLFILKYVNCQSGCQPACCDVLAVSDDKSIIGIDCTPGGIDCAFSGQITACCGSINQFTKVGNNCQRA